MQYLKAIVLLANLTVFVHGELFSQQDSAFYVSYPDMVTGRFYFSQKYTSLQFRNLDRGFNVNYRPNTTLNMGLGATYKWATLNLAYGFDFLNPDRGHGDTDYLDLQVHGFGRKMTVNLLGQLYKGFYLNPRGTATNDETYYLRPDMKIFKTGLSAQYIFNHERFSYQAAFHQSEWQKKSAGSFLLGFETYLGSVNADSTIVPTLLSRSAAEQNNDKIQFYEFGPNLGYAYSLIIRKHFFVTASASVSLDYGKTTIYNDIEDEKFSGFSPNLFLRAFWGYNSDLWGVSFIYLNNRVNLSASNEPGRRMALNTGNFRLNIIRRFSPGRKMKKVLKPVDQVEKNIDL